MCCAAGGGTWAGRRWDRRRSWAVGAVGSAAASVEFLAVEKRVFIFKKYIRWALPALRWAVAELGLTWQLPGLAGVVAGSPICDGIPEL